MQKRGYMRRVGACSQSTAYILFSIGRMPGMKKIGGVLAPIYEWHGEKKTRMPGMKKIGGVLAPIYEWHGEKKTRMPGMK